MFNNFSLTRRPLQPLTDNHEPEPHLRRGTKQSLSTLEFGELLKLIKMLTERVESLESENSAINRKLFQLELEFHE